MRKDTLSITMNRQAAIKEPFRHRIVSLIVVILLIIGQSTAFVPLSQCRVRQLPTTVFLATDQTLESMTVKELRSLVKETTQERGVLSKLKRKQDLIDFLAERQRTPEKSNGNSLPSSSSRRKPLQMPKLEAANGKETPKVNGEKSISSSPSPKDAIFEQVYLRHPSVRHQAAEDDKVDFRQLEHPIFKDNAAKSSDMDLVFVGTASCTPGTTRGVSCTALRLNWRRRASFFGDNNNNQGAEQSSSFQGGTWLFDVGECTQVSRGSGLQLHSLAKDSIRDAGTRPRALPCSLRSNGDAHLLQNQYDAVISGNNCSLSVSL